VEGFKGRGRKDFGKDEEIPEGGLEKRGDAYLFEKGEKAGVPGKEVR